MAGPRAPLVLLAAAPAVPIFRFVGGAAPNAIWTEPCGSLPLVEVAIDEPFAALAQCAEWAWTAHPAPPAVPTHLRCAYAWPELLLNSCCHSDEQAHQGAAPMAHCTRPSELGEIWTATLETALIPLDKPVTSTARLLKLLLDAAKTIRTDPRLNLTLARTCPIQPAPVGGLLAARWPLLVSCRLMNSHPEEELLAQMWLLWRAL